MSDMWSLSGSSMNLDDDRGKRDARKAEKKLNDTVEEIQRRTAIIIQLVEDNNTEEALKQLNEMKKMNQTY